MNAVAVIAGVSGATAIWLGLGQLAEQSSCSGRAIGEVVGLRPGVEGGSLALVAFRTAGGEQLTCALSSESWVRSPCVGDRFAVRYDPACPQHARMDVSDLAWWDGPGGWLAFGVLPDRGADRPRRRLRPAARRPRQRARARRAGSRAAGERR